MIMLSQEHSGRGKTIKIPARTNAKISANFQALVPKPQKGTGADIKTSWANPPHHPITFKHEGGVLQTNSWTKNILNWSPLLAYPKYVGWSARGGM